MGFHNRKAVKKFHVEKRINEIVNRLNKTKREEYPDLKAQRDAYDQAKRVERKLVGPNANAS